MELDLDVVELTPEEQEEMERKAEVENEIEELKQMLRFLPDFCLDFIINEMNIKTREDFYFSYDPNIKQRLINAFPKLVDEHIIDRLDEFYAETMHEYAEMVTIHIGGDR